MAVLRVLIGLGASAGLSPVADAARTQNANKRRYSIAGEPWGEGSHAKRRSENVLFCDDPNLRGLNQVTRAAEELVPSEEASHLHTTTEDEKVPSVILVALNEDEPSAHQQHTVDQDDPNGKWSEFFGYEGR